LPGQSLRLVAAPGGRVGAVLDVGRKRTRAVCPAELDPVLVHKPFDLEDLFAAVAALIGPT
jgi:hypothetical protein